MAASITYNNPGLYQYCLSGAFYSQSSCRSDMCSLESSNRIYSCHQVQYFEGKYLHVVVTRSEPPAQLSRLLAPLTQFGLACCPSNRSLEKQHLTPDQRLSTPSTNSFLILRLANTEAASDCKQPSSYPTPESSSSRATASMNPE